MKRDNPSDRGNGLDVGPVLFRCACFPVEMADSISSPDLTMEADSWLDREENLRSDAEGLVEELYRAVPIEPDRTIRALLLALRRALHGSLQPVPGEMLDGALASCALSYETKSALEGHAASRLHMARDREQFDRMYAEAAARERAALYLVTADDAFRKALYLASPATISALGRLQSASDKQRRRLEETLHSYLMRAVGRAAPNGAWSGVALEGRCQASCAFVFTPILEPFAAAIRAIADQEPWCREVPPRVNPTLRREGSQWKFERVQNGKSISYRLEDHPLLAQLVHLRAGNQALPSEICARKDLVQAGILLPGLELPRIFRDPWDAIDQVIPFLPASEQPAWRACIRDLRGIAERLGREFEALPLDALQAGMDEARRMLDALLARYQVPPVSRDRHVLLADRRVALTSPPPAGLKDRVQRAIRAYWAFDRYGVGEKHARRARRFFGQLPSDGMSLVDLASRDPIADGSDDSDDECLTRWRTELAPVAHHRRHELSACGHSSCVPPGSSVVMIDDGDRLRLGGISPDPCLLYSRFNALFRTSGQDDSFFEWYRSGIGYTESIFPELLFTDVALSSPSSMNASARHNMTGRLLDVSRDDAGTLRFYSDSTEWPKLRAGADAPAIVPRVHTAAALDGSDMHELVIQQFAFLHGRPNLLLPLPPFSDEAETWHHLPRLMLDDFSVSPERWTPGQELVDELGSLSGSERYLAWRRYTRRAGMTELVYVRSGQGGLPVLFRSDSVLDIDLLGHRLSKQGGPLFIQEALPSPRNSWLKDSRGFHYSAELVIAWHGDEAFWASYLGYETS